MKQVYEQHAEVCKTLANSKRLEIINLLRGGELSVARLLFKTSLLKANLSQHLSLMRAKGIIIARKKGLTVFYRLANPKIIRACDLMREVLFEQMKEKGEALKKWSRKT
ncbi:transcriptional regulator [Candidatus Saganbacteria bacterium CG08_land_8_20_14_0_20_45_16]|uniref:Transcriptional regulator n=1 Tax=Candidatus Saganbacteria bacterium CG08_land_8_20_14_0_20_45_16 TaxID=2014293 RepID=A0A2H0XU36_UNCSA|nr:MAG: transcriptional regulator [Candidatus Saganbacteria bacterium CG08_land_8_20_14_0_20_45_16]